ncbi:MULTISPECIES: GAF domain-containing protein [unclassified Polaromonas]|uniref:sensor domain-containing diguanylate cyclase n=1 Tax=unclassified Polaromonas TaxID=2638319 RepID=UPI000F07CCF8|nr:MULTISPECIES: GAF domain-containing protein [unclassified Polaromonas]AYQ29471.1 GAF domain-containing protein [Polaromonas sp. SP1]QGJ19413.1 GAF domain-containing protein [Polaromonas sp. Pch-P]
MLLAPIPDTDNERLDALRNGFCAYAPREERFDRITRTAKRLLDVPISLISIVEEDEQWFRSVQGIEVDHTARDISFCGHAVAINKPLCIPDAWEDIRFHDNPLVLGPPGIRSYLGWPLEIAPGLPVGSLCVIDTMPRTFGPEEWEALRDLAAMAEAELRVRAMSSLQGKLMMRLSALQRKGALDPLTGCWNIRGFRELLALGVEDARANATDLAVCSLRVDNLEEVAEVAGFSNHDALTLMLAQVLRQRLPQNGALARLGPHDFCALVPAKSAMALEEELAKLSFPSATVNLPGSKLRLDIALSIRVSWLADLGPKASADKLWAHALLTRAA